MGAIVFGPGKKRASKKVKGKSPSTGFIRSKVERAQGEKRHYEHFMPSGDKA
jgi:hypothetical protein